ncbi:type VI secretion system amidase immunity protein Tai4 [Erwinia amylovora]|uniref:T6SS amidase immunity protein Tai4 family protein n=2 Tax=Erwinia amylovora TaxID=552 RepID=UPI000C08715A|nr:T6SS amidase immunity protein Tai4 family protein [Erwinia amylovora]MBZ2400624.1 type VI secretion system amidase immunity protein Tai4 [Erwinia amylovora]MBZ2404215.1 type VI secretion system amidase immunity protein Tai4 [Erwinia amylovora]UDJ86154.1 type VI secretion system amidase immunity protein Tai4 [Erwinia amylovora]UDJ97619.1 type VI secretion system amidase immunity protein Tai4 [Erwinia amylovora]UDK90321.1 type VI secretion system amidase immunity protein Tai4 [Erwinia amylovo
MTVSLLTILLLTINAYANNKYSPQTNLKNYALSSCISQGYQSKEVKEDAAAAARGYLGFGDYSLAAHTAVRKLGKAFLAKEYTSQSGEPMTLAKCIDFYHSGQLDKLVKEFKGKQDD